MYKAGSRYSVVTLGADGTERGSLFIGEEILDFSAAGKYVAVLTASDLRIYDETLTLYASTDNVAAATDVIQRAPPFSSAAAAARCSSPRRSCKRRRDLDMARRRDLCYTLRNAI